MNRLIKMVRRSVIAVALLCATAVASAQSRADEPIITFHTNLYDLHGVENIFTFYLGSTEDTYVDVDCGFGTFEVEVSMAEFDTDTSSIQGSPVTCTVGPEGVVKVYGDPKLIDFIDMEGCYISSIEWPRMTEIDILNMDHNQLESLDLSHMTKLRALYLNDNPFTRETPLVVGANKPELVILHMAMTEWVSPTFNLSDFPSLVSFIAYSSPSLSTVDPSGCPELMQLSIDGTSVESVDTSKNPKLLVLNVSNTRINAIDVSNNIYLTELYCQQDAVENVAYKLTGVDVSKNTRLQRLHVSGNRIKSLDLSNNPQLLSLQLSDNLFETLSFDGLDNLNEIDISKNYMTFTSLPAPRPSYSDYIYQQNAMKVDRSYKVGTVIDFSDKVIREGTVTNATLYGVSRDDPGNPVMLDTDYYEYGAGKITLLKEYGDSVYVSFQNTMFPDCRLNTTRFMVKSEENYGERIATITLPTSVLAKEQAMKVGIDGATEENPIKFYVDFGNGQLVEFAATSTTLPDEPNVTGTRAGAKTTIYVDENVDVTAFAIDGIRLNGALNMSEAPMLRYLSVTNCSLSSINLDWNRCLAQLDLSGNNLTALSLLEPNAYYTKTMLGDINLSNNKLTSLTMVDNYGIHNVNVANNRLTSFNLGHATRLETLDISGNLIEEVSLSDCEMLEHLNMADNLVSELAVPDYVPLKSLNIAGNSFAIPALPQTTICEEYIYAPQRVIPLPTKAPSVNLSAQYVDIDGVETQYRWLKTSDNSEVADGDIIETEKGRYKFVNTTIGEVYCLMTHAAYPELAGDKALKTTNVLTAEPPTNVFATMKAAEDGEASLSIAGKNNGTTVYVDWKESGDFEQYILKSAYTVYSAKIEKDKTARFYSYEDKDDVTVFSVSGPFTDVDASKMSAAFCFALYGAKIGDGEVKLPEQSRLTELSLYDCGLNQLPDLSGCISLEHLNVMNNKLTELDVTSFKALETLYASNNRLTEIKLANPRLWEAMLSGNQLSELDLTNVPAMSQLWASHNKLSHLDISHQRRWVTLIIDNNYFDFSTLPIRTETMQNYSYTNQAPLHIESIDGVVDLSSQAMSGTTPTQYYWFIDSPYLDENGNLAGEELYIDEEYTLENGVTTFLKPFDHIICVMVNGNFPNLYLLTNFIDTYAAGIEGVEIDDNDGKVEYYNLQGVKVANPSNGIYIRCQGGKATKVKL